MRLAAKAAGVVAPGLSQVAVQQAWTASYAGIWIAGHRSVKNPHEVKRRILKKGSKDICVAFCLRVQGLPPESRNVGELLESPRT